MRQIASDGDYMDKYEILVRGHLDIRRADCFEGLKMSLLPGGETLLSGLLRDQAELHAILSQIRDMGIELISVKQTGKTSV
jgi:hypothetical protein